MRHIDYGIDLGTTNSCVARSEGGEVRVIQNADQMNVTPSVVRVMRSGGVMTGRRAYNAVVEDPDNVAAEFKRLMGQKFQRPFPASGREMSPEELSAEVLKSLLADARRQTGDEARAAVITVPAAFTALQCEATARAARLAGLEEFPLLQEPIAAAVAYGARPGARDQRWLVFDLGGGTFDTAVVSTRDNRLSVLEHRGDNHLGGKDLDRAVVQNVFLPFLSERFALPSPQGDPAAFNRLARKLTFVAEYSKIELTNAEETIVSFIDLGEDLEGRFIEAELTLTRAELERELEPLLARCLRLAQDALDGARLGGADLDRILLVGGPTQMPAVRARVGASLGARVDFSLDPMTVVARGACVYASSVERQTAAPTNTTRALDSAKTNDETHAAADVSRRRAAVRLAFDAVSASVEAIVAGRVADARVREVSVAAEGGFWESGWHPVREELFEIAVRLQEGKLCAFRLAARDARGLAVAVEPETFQIRHGLEVGAPPLPHTISVEVARADGTPRLDAVFPRKTLLPAEKTVHYRAARTLRPSEPETALAIKLWEGEALDDPQANHWVGNMHVRSEHLRRPIPEGAEIQLHVRIDASRLITVDVFVPHLNEHFTERVYIPRDEEPDYAELLAGVPYDLETYLARLARVEARLLLREAETATTEEARETEDEFPEFVFDEEEAGHHASPRHRPTRAERPALVEVELLRREAEDLDIEITLRNASGGEAEHDSAKGFVERAREIRARLVNLERRAGLDPRAASLE
ncbi:MAG TPA: Hsp70 family protein, partial [Pyrinomonadaceae bacterium]|nr:Hsp70 family protein [Pyrinomonadaceae bacterium]